MSKLSARKRKTTQKGLRTKYWTKLRKLILQRDFWECQICKSGDLPSLQVDHCFSRGNNSLFFEPSNLTTLCSGCHFKKSKLVHGYEKLVDNIVQEREGKAMWILLEHKVKQPHKWTEEEVCQVIKDLEAELK